MNEFNRIRPRDHLIIPTHIRGGADPERLYLHDSVFQMSNGEWVKVTRTDIQDVDMKDLVVRHKARYYIALTETPINGRFLDFPCGSGYGAQILTDRTGVQYVGMDHDGITVTYAQHMYGSPAAQFVVADMQNPPLPPSYYDTVGCLEGFEHIEEKDQLPLLKTLYRTLKPGGTLVISSPENPNGISGRSTHNKFHLYELTYDDFKTDLFRVFGEKNVVFITQFITASTGVPLHMVYGICKKGK